MSNTSIRGDSSDQIDIASQFPEPSAWIRWTLSSVFARTLADRLTMALVTGAAMFVFGVWMGPLFASMEDSLADMTDGFGEGFIDVFGDFATPTGWLNAELYSLMVPAVMVYVAVSSAAAAFAREQQERSVGLLVANPIDRRTIGLEKVLGTLGHVAVVAGLSGAGTWLGVQIASLDVSASHVLAITVHLFLFGAVVAATATVFAVTIGRRVPCMVITACIVLVAYVWGQFAPISDSLDSVAILSPWYWYFGSDPLENGFHLGHLVLLTLLTAGLVAVAIRRFDQRDLPG